MKHKTEQRGDGVVAIFEGDVDLESSPTARTVLLDCVGRSKKVAVDMSAVSYIDSSGIASMVEAYQTARKNNGRFALAAVSEPALRVLQLARLDKVFPIYATVDEALAAD